MPSQLPHHHYIIIIPPPRPPHYPHILTLISIGHFTSLLHSPLSSLLPSLQLSTTPHTSSTPTPPSTYYLSVTYKLLQSPTALAHPFNILTLAYHCCWVLIPSTPTHPLHPYHYTYTIIFILLSSPHHLLATFTP